MTPTVSILIPSFNAASWIEDTLKSALGQTHPNTEIIVIDDGSTDATAEIAAAIARDAPSQIKVIRQANAGASAARNHAMRLARGDYLQFLDADDLLSPGKIELQLTRLSAAPAGSLATCRWGRFEKDPARAEFCDTDVFSDFTPIEWLLLHASKARMMHPAAWLVPRAVAGRAGPWDESLSLNDDGEYFSRVVIASSGIAFTSESAASTYYRSGMTGSLSNRHSLTACESLHRAGKLLSEHLLTFEDSPRVRQALADHWRFLTYELYPDAPALSRDSEQQSETFGGSCVKPPLGTRAQYIARVFGWRMAMRLRRLSHG